MSPVHSVTHVSRVGPHSRWCRRGESNPRPRDYETLALPLSYAGTGRTCYGAAEDRVKPIRSVADRGSRVCHISKRDGVLGPNLSGTKVPLTPTRSEPNLQLFDYRPT